MWPGNGRTLTEDFNAVAKKAFDDGFLIVGFFTQDIQVACSLEYKERGPGMWHASAVSVLIDFATCPDDALSAVGMTEDDLNKFFEDWSLRAYLTFQEVFCQLLHPLL